MEGVTRAASDHGGRRCEPPAVDRLSALRDSLLLHILSFLRVKDVVLTSLLSQRWRHLWTCTPCLDFSIWKPTMRSARNYLSLGSIDRALVLHEGQKLKSFFAGVRGTDDDEGVEYQYSELVMMVDSWVHFALRRRVEELELDCLEVADGGYTVPHRFVTCESLVSLTLWYCRLDLPSRIFMSSLKNLTLCSVTFRGDNLKDLLGGCPLLECLTLRDCFGFFKYNICVDRADSCLKTLKICESSDLVRDSDYGLHISAPSITTLVLQGYLRPYYAVKDFSSIVMASLDFKLMVFWETGFDECEDLALLLHDLHHVQVLKLCSWCIQFKDDVLEEHPNDKTKSVMSHERTSPNMLHLKTINIFGLLRAMCAEDENKTVGEILEKYQDGFEFIRFLLMNSPILERLTIGATENGNNLTKRNLEMLSRFSSRLLAFPRASRKALVIIPE